MILNFINKTAVYSSLALLSVQTISAQIFSDFTYKGNDKIYAENPLKDDEFYSPILQGCYPEAHSINRKNGKMSLWGHEESHTKEN